MSHLDQKERDRLRKLDADEKNTETNIQVKRIHMAIHAGTLDKATIDDALERITELHVKPDDNDRLGGPDKAYQKERESTDASGPKDARFDRDRTVEQPHVATAGEVGGHAANPSPAAQPGYPPNQQFDPNPFHTPSNQR